MPALLKGSLPLFIMLVQLSAYSQKPVKILTVPGRSLYTHIDVNDKTVLPSGRFVTPAGRTIQITHDPFGLAVSPDGQKTITLHNGVFTIINNATLSNIRVPSY